jgi:hypothetical protein
LEILKEGTVWAEAEYSKDVILIKAAYDTDHWQTYMKSSLSFTSVDMGFS